MPGQLSRADLLRGLSVAGVATALTACGAGVAAAVPASPPGQDHPNLELIRRYYQAYASGDLGALRRFFAPDISWTIPGHHPLAGTKRGVDEVLAFFGQLARAGFKAETIFLAADRDWVVDLHRGWSTTPAGLDMTWALAFRINAGTIVEAVNFAGDQHAADAFFWRQYPLAALPARLGQA
ncbi:nuclear transport factor 2 family protein [Pseudonocardia acaciae]|uniref:nuclear transport factor 2 family protein n=1 Tax=Pseudonocardia acaciae TaxID=551276 RepID=UPI00048F5419|nr:nuclear transport factor 2 family protein [Pseudonocardia acaciae]